MPRGILTLQSTVCLYWCLMTFVTSFLFVFHREPVLVIIQTFVGFVTLVLFCLQSMFYERVLCVISIWSFNALGLTICNIILVRMLACWIRRVFSRLLGAMHAVGGGQTHCAWGLYSNFLGTLSTVGWPYTHAPQILDTEVNSRVPTDLLRWDKSQLSKWTFFWTCQLLVHERGVCNWSSWEKRLGIFSIAN